MTSIFQPVPSVTTQPSTALATLIEGVVDYAGLFPPAALTMSCAVEAYAAYLNDPHRSVLARFIVPMGRLSEFALETEALSAFGRGSPWALAVLAGADAAADVLRIDEFNQQYRGRALIDVVEAKATSVGDVEHIVQTFARPATPLQLYIEVPVNADLTSLITTMARLGVRAKIRTGGVTPDAFPTPAQVLHFMQVCLAHRVPFKATAGLHHPMYGEYRLTYAPDSPKGTMYGFLNVFLSAAFLSAGLSGDEVTHVLTERDPDAFRFEETGVTWQTHTLTLEQLRHTRQHVALSFGSCSFREPVDELTARHLL